MASDKRTHILSTAQKLFQEKGLGMVTMEDVARAAGMGKSSLYYYFKSKEEIFDAVLETEISEIILETMKRMSSRSGLLEKLMAFAAVKFEMARKRKSLYRAMEAGMDAVALSRYNELKKGVHLRYLEKEKVILQQLLIQAAGDRSIKTLHPKELDQAVMMFLSALRGMNREITLFGSAEQADELLPAFCRLFQRGLQ
ncbi:TetR/AcrR family transcriptional regulator [Chitinophaga qingshengii]|uniref:TetR/AcrR family transcriptional regulator n=1 Tax=Chitinophaga qingshengii TaxID=1569794 RepID=A0ABR7TRM3_9BACT|nr:TetR/AcrR family transcriptional regulator [Chitinophaga qingshengii]MBC9933139.1 TetR/AcrR family transcriptional regulator [Chitinophaga qingshengii]